jgi:hypothetical protein
MLGVVRLQLINTQSLVWVPLIVLAGAVVISLIIIGLIPGDDVKVVGAANAPLWYFVALGVQSMTLAFPFSQAMSVTRREFFSGTLVLGAIASAMMASIFLILAGIEALTDGFWMNGRIAYRRSGSASAPSRSCRSAWASASSSRSRSSSSPRWSGGCP